MKRYLALVLLLIAVPAEAKFRTGSEWSGLPPEARTFYVAGVRDFMGMYASRGKDPRAARIHTCLGAARFAPAATADFILEWIKHRTDVAESNAAVFVLSYILDSCESASADHAEPAKPVVTYKAFAGLTPPLQASYIEAVQDALEALSLTIDSRPRELRECMTRSGLTDKKRLASAVTEYVQLNERRIGPNASFAEATVVYLLAHCK
jgi:hypothetical protein